ncbi:DUF2336 domain-containing protein [Peteryoungia desertarenae]|uniref:DUF2336 domain-containing protein n=1 Tax=Peteryoungia desertarenae TaxID=1813451 RepID=A0ABX6QMT4_9HYPH|nr:DUF2336 domain-containing protein [Peteryoungia desertarenae]QLF69824.1 DUF2336 domain-containing protein [Peteryoungia desertarenae]
MSEQFRELEKPVGARRKDVVLMATVTSFQALSHPGKMELKQFAELFQPLFQASSAEARRDAVAALSQSANLPSAVSLFIASQPISISAPFLASSPALTDEVLIMIARTQGADHAKAIVKREHLSPMVVDALVALRHSTAANATAAATGDEKGDHKGDQKEQAGWAKPVSASAARPVAEHVVKPMPKRTGEGAAPVATGRIALKGGPVINASLPDHAEEQRLKREELLRQKLKALAHHFGPRTGDRLGKRTITPVQEALLVRFARARDASNFASALSDVLSSSRWLAERILLDISGRQLATTLVGVAMNPLDNVFILHRLYPHLTEENAGISRAESLVAHLDVRECEDRIESWHRADRYTFGDDRHDIAGDAATGRDAQADRDALANRVALEAARQNRRAAG